MPGQYELEQSDDLNTLSENENHSNPFSEKETADIEFRKLRVNQKKLKKLKKSLDGLVDAYAEQTSLLAKAAIFWGKLVWWQKILIGTIVVVPMFIAGLLAHIGVLLAISIIALTVYTAASLLLDNHHQQSKLDIDKLKTGLSGMTTLFESIISSLDEIREQLSILIDKFSEQNERLTEEVNKLHEQVKCLTTEVDKLAYISNKLAITELELEQTSKRLTTMLNEHQRVQEEHVQYMNQLIERTQLKEEELGTEIGKLTKINSELSHSLNTAKKVGQILQDAVHSLTDGGLLNLEQREVFLQRMEEFINNKELSFVELTQKMESTISGLEETKEGFKKGNDTYSKLLKRQEKQIERLEQIATDEEIQRGFHAWRVLGLFANPTGTKALEQDTKCHIREQINNQVAYIL